MNRLAANVRIIFKPLYELMTSLIVFIDGSLTRQSELGAPWSRALKKQLDPGFAKKLRDKTLRKDLANYIDLLILTHDQPIDTVTQFGAWLSELNLKKLTEYTALSATLLEKSFPRLKNYQQACAILEEWDRCYFSGIDPGVIKGLERNAREKEQLAEKLPVVDFVEQVTCGIRLEQLPEGQRLFLIPQYHAVPMNIYTLLPGLFICHYPADAAAEAPGEPSPRLMRLTAALADQSRLRIMRFLSPDQRTFMEIVKFSGLAKSTVHHHLIALRAAGLIRVQLKGNDRAGYSLRRSMLEQVSEKVLCYIDEGKEHESEAASR